LTDEGADFTKLRISYESELNRVIKAKTDIQEGETCLFVPKSCFINFDTADSASNPKWEELTETQEGYKFA